jgi:hypothetical protein
MRRDGSHGLEIRATCQFSFDEPLVVCQVLIFGCHWLSQYDRKSCSDCLLHWQSQWHTTRIFRRDRPLARGRIR